MLASVSIIDSPSSMGTPPRDAFRWYVVTR